MSKIDAETLKEIVDRLIGDIHPDLEDERALFSEWFETEQ